MSCMHCACGRPLRSCNQSKRRWWLGSAQTLHYKRHFKLFGLWLPRPGTEPALDALRQALEGMETREQVLPESGMPLLMVRSETQP